MISKENVNWFLKKFNLELHGTSYMQSLRSNSSLLDAFEVQANLLGIKTRTIFDIGANYGDTVKKYRAIFSDAHIYAFEPFPDVYTSLERRFSSEPHVNCFPFAISNAEGKQIFYTNQNPDTNSLLKPQKMGLRSDQQVSNLGNIEVETITLDKFCNMHSISEVDILKMDIQGGELNALEGAVDLLSKKRIKLIYTESYFRRQYESQPLFHEISNFLEQFGYYLQDIYSPIYGKGSLVWCDAIFIPES